MIDFPYLDNVTGLPKAYDDARAREGFKDWSDRIDELGDEALREAAAGFTALPAGNAVLTAIFGNSPFLTKMALREPMIIVDPFRTGFDQVMREEMERLASALGVAAGKADVMRVLRTAKRRVALLVAVADITGSWSLQNVTAAMSTLADSTLDGAVSFLLADGARRGDIVLKDPEHPCLESGLCVFGLGKLGARELNYSSDIDLMVLYDQDVVDYRGSRDPTDFYARLTRSLVELMNERTADGYVFRTDLRLRPDPGASPLALSMAAAESYYESLGQNWERAALIKSRTVAGDKAAGDAFLSRLAPFIWRKYLDYAAIEDIHSIKRQITSHRGHGGLTVAGHNIKVGGGGIREIEFFTQTQQLIAGGRDPDLRDPTTCGALRKFVESGRLSKRVADQLISAYEFLRRLEHRLQMIGDEQTQTLPREQAGLTHVATFMGFDDREAFAKAVIDTLRVVQMHYAALFESAPSLAGDTGSLVFTGTDDDADTLATLARMGFSEPARVSAIIRNWHHGRYRATRSGRARELLTAIMPTLLHDLAATADPDGALLRFDTFLARLPAGVQLFALIYANPWLLARLARIMGSAPSLAELLSRNSSLLEAMLDVNFFEHAGDPGLDAAELDEMLDRTSDFQDVLDALRRWTNDHRFQVGLQVLEGIMDVDEAGPRFANVAEIALTRLYPRVVEQFAEQHGRVPDGEMVVVALGKLGSREMTFTSDLDLILIYDMAADAGSSDGARPLPPTQYFARLSQRFIGAITSMTSEGRLYEVDMRLRPSGKAGPIAITLDAFRNYQLHDAWTWEHMALTRARIIAGPADLAERVRATIEDVLSLPREAGALRADVASMRERIAAEHREANPWRVKHVRGGLVDLEFLAQYLQLRHGGDGSTAGGRGALFTLKRAGTAGHIARQTSMDLVAAGYLLYGVQQIIRICASDSFDEASASADLKAVLARVLDVDSFEAAREKLIEAEALVKRHFDEIIGAAPSEQKKPASG